MYSLRKKETVSNNNSIQYDLFLIKKNKLYKSDENHSYLRRYFSECKIDLEHVVIKYCSIWSFIWNQNYINAVKKKKNQKSIKEM